LSKNKTEWWKSWTWNLSNNYFNDYNKKIPNVNNAKNIKYVCFNSSSKSQIDFTVSLDGSNNTTKSYSEYISSYSIELDSKKFDCAPRMLLKSRDKWFINTCNDHILNEVISLLQLGEGFCLPPVNKTDLIIAYIKHIENNFSRFRQQQACVSSMRSQLFDFLKPLN